jgi:hypothetical protein
MPKSEPHYRVALFTNTHTRTFTSRSEMLDYIKRRAQKAVACYTEVWKMENETDGEQVAVFGYGCSQPVEMVEKYSNSIG